MTNTSIKQKIGLILFGVFLCVILIELGLRIGGYVVLSSREQRNKLAVKEKGSFKILCLGGSTTAMGISKDLSDEEAAYPAFLEKELNKSKIRIKFKVINEGVCSVNSSYILSNLEKNIEKYKPDMIVTMIGLNDGFFPPELYNESLKTKIVMFFKGARIYKLFRLVWASITNQSYSRFKNVPEKNIIEAKISNDKPKGAYDLLNEAIVLLNEERPFLAETLIKEAIQKRPNNADLYVWLGECYFGQKDFDKAESAIKKAISIDPTSSDTLNRLALCYFKQDRYKDAERIYLQVIDKDPFFRDAYGELMTNYKSIGDLEGIRKLCEKIESLDTKEYYLYGVLASGYRELGEISKVEKYYKKSNELRSEYYKPLTRHNYLKIKETVDKHGLKLVCVQYPVRQLESLKKLLFPNKGIIFVDNEKIFKDALRNGEYSDYFGDYVGGEFGHATVKGNKLLAENIANTILKEYFNQ